MELFVGNPVLLVACAVSVGLGLLCSWGLHSCFTSTPVLAPIRDQTSMITIHRRQSNTLPARNFQSPARVVKASTIKIEPPPGGGCRIYRVKGLNVQLGKGTRELALDSAPQTPGDAEIWGRVLLPTTGSVILKENLVLLNYDKGRGGVEEALKWAEHYQLPRTDLYRIFALGKERPYLHHKLERNPVYGVETSNIDTLIQGIMWHETERGGLTRKVCADEEKFSKDSCTWYAFRMLKGVHV